MQIKRQVIIEMDKEMYLEIEALSPKASMGDLCLGILTMGLEAIKKTQEEEKKKEEKQ